MGPGAGGGAGSPPEPDGDGGRAPHLLRPTPVSLVSVLAWGCTLVSADV